MSDENKKARKSNKKTEGVNTEKWFFFIFSGFLVLALPLVYSHKILDPVLAPRLLVLSIFLVVMTIIACSKKIACTFNFTILRHKIFPVLLAYFLITILSMIFAINYREGIYDSLKTFNMLVLTAIIAIIFSKTGNWEIKLSRLVMFAALFASSYGFIDYLNHVATASGSTMHDGRPVIYLVSGLMGHKNQYAISMMLMLPFLGFGIYSHTGWWRRMFILSVVMLLIMIVLIQTRSVWVGMVISTVGTIGVSYLYNKHIKFLPAKLNILTISILIPLFIGLIFVLSSGKPHQDSVTAKIKNIANTNSVTNKNRIKIWNITLDMISEHPLTGVGAGNWKLKAPSYYKGYHLNQSELNWLRPHNDYLWVWAEKGIIGILIFMGIFILSFYYLHKIFISKICRQKKAFSLFLFSGIVAYLVVSLVSFPHERINQQVYLSLFIGGIVAIFHQNQATNPIQINRKLILLSTIPLLLFSAIYSFAMLRMESIVKEARIAHLQTNWVKMHSVAEEIPTTFRNLDAEAMPLDYYQGLANQKLGNIDKAKKNYGSAIKANPTKINILNNLGLIYFDENEFTIAEEHFQKAIDIYPFYHEALVNLSSTYDKLGEIEKAYKTLLTVPEKHHNKQYRQAINRYYKSLGKRWGHSNEYYDIYSGKFAGDVIFKYRQQTINNGQWFEEVDKKARENHNTIKQELDSEASNMSIRQEFESYLTWHGIEFYKTIIVSDSSWKNDIIEKSRLKNISPDRQLSDDADFTFMMENPMIHKKYHQIRAFQNKIMTNPELFPALPSKAKEMNMDLNEVIKINAVYLADISLHIKSPREEAIASMMNLIRNNTAWHQAIRKKAIDQKKAVDDMIREDAIYLLEESGELPQ
nr:O-antigen ligase family protein [Bacteroidota bacterium]